MDTMLDDKVSYEQAIIQLGFEEKDTNKENNNELITIAQWVLDANPSIVQQYYDGKLTVVAFFVGQIMRQTQGKVDPNLAKEIVEKLLIV